jgi:hypothetical protein
VNSVAAIVTELATLREPLLSAPYV